MSYSPSPCVHSTICFSLCPLFIGKIMNSSCVCLPQSYKFLKEAQDLL